MGAPGIELVSINVDRGEFYRAALPIRVPTQYLGITPR